MIFTRLKHEFSQLAANDEGHSCNSRKFVRPTEGWRSSRDVKAKRVFRNIPKKTHHENMRISPIILTNKTHTLEQMFDDAVPRPTFVSLLNHLACLGMRESSSMNVETGTHDARARCMLTLTPTTCWGKVSVHADKQTAYHASIVGGV